MSVLENGFVGGQYELAPGSVYGVRRWGVNRNARGILNSACADYSWHPNVENVARCYPILCKTRLTGFAAADSTHECVSDGFWAYHTGKVEYGSGGVVGIMEGYGETVIGTKGFRSRKAKIVALVKPPQFGGHELVGPQRAKPRRLAYFGRVGGWFAGGLATFVAAVVTDFHYGWFHPLAFVAGVLLVFGFPLSAGWHFEKFMRPKPENCRELLTDDHRYPGWCDCEDRLRQSPCGWGHLRYPTEAQWAMILETYPDVPVFDTLEEAMKVFPVQDLSDMKQDEAA